MRTFQREKRELKTHHNAFTQQPDSPPIKIFFISLLFFLFSPCSRCCIFYPFNQDGNPSLEISTNLIKTCSTQLLTPSSCCQPLQHCHFTCSIQFPLCTGLLLFAFFRFNIYDIRITAKSQALLLFLGTLSARACAYSCWWAKRRDDEAQNNLNFSNFNKLYWIFSLVLSFGILRNCFASAVCHTFTSIVKGTQLTPSNFVANSLVFNLFICVVLSSSSQSLLLLTTEWCDVRSEWFRSLLQSFLDLLGQTNNVEVLL